MRCTSTQSESTTNMLLIPRFDFLFLLSSGTATVMELNLELPPPSFRQLVSEILSVRGLAIELQEFFVGPGAWSLLTHPSLRRLYTVGWGLALSSACCLLTVLLLHSAIQRETRTPDSLKSTRRSRRSKRGSAAQQPPAREQQMYELRYTAYDSDQQRVGHGTVRGHGPAAVRAKLWDDISRSPRIRAILATHPTDPSCKT